MKAETSQDPASFVHGCLGSNHDTILESYSPKFQWLEKFGGVGFIRLRIRSCAGRWPLLGCEVADVRCSFIFDGLVLERLLFRFSDVVVMVTHPEYYVAINRSGGNTQLYRRADILKYRRILKTIFNKSQHTRSEERQFSCNVTFA